MSKVKLKVQTKDGQRGGDFETLEEAQAFFEDYKSKGLWGKEAHTIHHEEQIIHHEEVITVPYSPAIPEVKDELGNIITPAIPEVLEEKTPAWDEIIPAYDEHIPAEYTYVIEDHTAEVEAERVKKETKHNDRVSRVAQFKAINWTSIDTIAELKAVVRILVNEAIKDDE